MLVTQSKWQLLLNRPSSTVFLRATAAIFGGYLLAANSVGLLALMLPLSPVDNVLVATMLSFAIYAGAALWSFSVKTSWQAWRDLLAVSAGFYVLILLLG
ncbi:hypothetical protein [Shewanella waksmanii]|uniref:hypothetical protein n=1 Tax=Shewanella waksmanii TaxID=213783 RepID=UPI003735F299